MNLMVNNKSCIIVGRMAQRIRRRTSNPKIAGSNPASIIKTLHFFKPQIQWTNYE